MTLRTGFWPPAQAKPSADILDVRARRHRMGIHDPPAVWYQYSPSWHGKYPQKHLARFKGKLQVDGYAGFEPHLSVNSR